jgi:hypothetical protein
VRASIRRSEIALPLALVLAGCSGGAGSKYPTYVPGDASTGTGSDAGAGAPNGAVSIEIHSPTADALLSTNSAADVSAKITISGGTGMVDLIDPSSVRASLSLLGNVSPLSATPLVGPTGESEYRGKLSLAGLKAGAYLIIVSARSSTGATGTAQVAVKLDSGPQITVLSPIPGRHYKGSLVVQVVADPGASGPLVELQASIGGMPLTLPPSGQPNQFRAVVDLTMPVALKGEQLFVVSAKNSSKNPTRTELRFIFVVDVDGPEITQTLPAPGEIVGGLIKISAHVNDGAGLNESSIQVLIGDKTNPQFKLALTLDGAGTYSVFFDTKNLTGCKPPPDTSLCIVHPTLSFRAADLLGNETTLAYEIAVDNIAPVADLVPPKIRVFKYDDVAVDGGPPLPGYICSRLFDPLSRDIDPGDMPNDGCTVPQVFDLRARIQDDSNRATGLKLGPISTVDPEATAIYILNDPTVNNAAQPLVVDTDGDGTCDAINPKLEPTSMPLQNARQVLKIRMRPVPPAGEGDYTNDPADMIPNFCHLSMTPNAPKNICDVEQPYVAISYAGKLPAIWAIEPIAPGNPNYCFGGQFDALANNVTEGGWKCIAVATADLNGNVSTSAPIRVWVDYDNQGSRNWCVPPMATAPMTVPPPPSCTGSYNRATGVVTPGPCTARKFPAGETCFENRC